MSLAHLAARATFAAFVAAVNVPASLDAQALPIPTDNPRLRAALDTIKAQEAWTVSQQISLCEIAAPPYKEAARAAEYRRRLQALGITGVHVDSVGNVIAERRGTGNGPTVLIEGHLDTVFPEGTDVRVKRNGTVLAGPGIGDDCRGLAVVLSVARAFQRANVQTAGTVYFVGDVGEEGQGNLRGTRYLFANSLKGRIDYFISVDGIGLDLKHHGVGSKRYRVTYKGPGGHSYGAFGIPNPIHALGRAIAQIADVQVPASPKTTFNVGVISGGTSVNSIPFSGVMDVDMRSETADALDAVDKQVLKILTSALDAENDRWTRQTGARAERAKLSLVIDTIGIRPANSTQTDSSRIVATALAAGRVLGFSPKSGASSTDANVPMSLGVPAITIDGGGVGSGAHSLGETYDDGPTGWLGPQWAALIVAALAGVR
jgi:acetylornithine deacetylase/succinyl-diaminopimelate desuccinylase-like protein